MSDKVVVRFLKAWRGYSADELAGFDEAVADGLKSKGFAEAYEAGGESTRKPAKASRPAASKPNSQKAGGKTIPPGSPEAPATGGGVVVDGPTEELVGDNTEDEVVGDDTEEEEKP